MKIVAQLQNSQGKNEVILKTDDAAHPLSIPPKATGFGSSANGGELLFLALATCYCNDIYREAAKRAIRVAKVEVAVEGDFGGEGEPARNVTYSARVSAEASERDIKDLMRQTDRVAEIQNTLRTATSVTLSRMEVETI
jgi:organic hydroperoxide reductase OsmC/OhrA